MIAAAQARPAPLDAHQDATALAKEAFVYGYPMVDNYAVLHAYALDPGSPEYKAPLNAISHARDVARPEDRAVVSPNVDTPYSYAWLDLRAEPVVLTIPPFEPRRYVSLQLVDAYTYILGYVTPRTNGEGGGDFLVAGPGWKGKVPRGIKKVFRSPTSLVLGLYRTRVLDEPGDLARVHALQDREELQQGSMRSFALLTRARIGAPGALEELAALDAGARAALGEKRPPSRAALDGAEALLVERLARIEKLRNQINPEVEIYVRTKAELNALVEASDRQATKGRLAVIAFARSHRNLAAGLPVPPEIDVLGALKGAAASGVTSIVP